jgi:N-acetylmuramoyl-L-alanine amidase
MTFSISDEHLLTGKRIIQRLSPNVGEKFCVDLPDTVILHYTASGDSEGAITHLCDPATEVSAHLVVSRSGEVTQLVPFNVIAWHAGESIWKERKSLNQYSIGIEIENAGYLEKKTDWYESWFGGRYSESEVYVVDEEKDESKKYWHRYTAIQIQVVTGLCSLLRDTYQIKEILGHSDVSPGRKVDPGPAFPIQSLVQSVLQ